MSTFDSLAWSPLQLANRLLMAPVKTAFGGADGKVTSPLIDCYRRRARGGVGASFVDPAGKAHPKQLAIATDDAIAGLRGLGHRVERIHRVKWGVL